MKKLFVFVFLYLNISRAEIEIVQRQSGEDAKGFVQRITKAAIHNGNQFAETNSLPTGKKTIVAFTELNDSQNETQFDLQLNVFKLQGDGKYSWSKVISCEQAGGSPTLRSFFYVNIEENRKKSIGLICGWDARHESECPQKDEVRFFKVTEQVQLNELNDTNISKNFYKVKKVATEDKDTMNCKYPLFENAKDVKRILKNVGF